MTIKIQCDQCGNIVSLDVYHQYQVYDQTPDRPQNYNQAHTKPAAPQNIGTLAGAGYAPRPTAFEVHLCPTCYPIWFERVKKLTEHTK